MPTIEASGPVAIDRARQMIWEKGVDVYKTRRAPQYVLKAKMRGQGDKAIDILIGDSQSKEFPVVQGYSTGKRAMSALSRAVVKAPVYSKNAYYWCAPALGAIRSSPRKIRKSIY